MRARSIKSVFEAIASQVPDRVALSSREVALTYRELDARGNRMARRLRSVAPIGSAIALTCGRSPEAVTALLAIVKAGCRYVPLFPGDPPARISEELSNASATVLITDGDAEAVAGQPPSLTILPISELDKDDGDGRCLQSGVGEDAVAYVMHTSGSTGHPKGVAVTHGNVLNLVLGQSYVHFGQDEIFCHYAPLAFDASTFEIWGALLNGGRLAIAPRDPAGLAEIAEVIGREGVTTLWLTAGVFHQMVEYELESLASVRQVVSGGDVVSPSHVKRLLEARGERRFVNGYGPTETTTFACCHVLHRPEEVEDPLPIGRPIGNVRVMIRGTAGEAVGQGEVGELLIGGQGVTKGYLNSSDLTEHRFVTVEGEAGRFYCSGDMARMRPDRVIDFLGRRDNQVKVRGFRIELDEIDAALRRLPAVAEGAAAVVDAGGGEKRLFACVVLRPDAEVDTSDLRHELGRVVPPYMVPGSIFRVPEMPLTPAGKIDRTKLAGIWGDRHS